MTNQNQSSKSPAYVAAVRSILAACESAQIPTVPPGPDAVDGLHGPSGWANVEVSSTGHKTYLKRTRNGAPAAVETTVPYELIPSHLITQDMRGKNGKIEARLVTDPALLIRDFLPVLLSLHLSGGKLRASRAPVRATPGAARAASEQPAAPARVGTMEDLTA